MTCSFKSKHSVGKPKVPKTDVRMSSTDSEDNRSTENMDVKWEMHQRIYTKFISEADL